MHFIINKFAVDIQPLIQVHFDLLEENNLKTKFIDIIQQSQESTGTLRIDGYTKNRRIHYI